MTETAESLTLDDGAMTRAADALGQAFKRGYRPHWCDEWDDGDGCELCWAAAADVIRAAEGLSKCSDCNGGGVVAPGDSCPECGGDGLEPLPS
jgi:hypothetical protein